MRALEISQRKRPAILDVTLRDCEVVNQWKFSSSQLEGILSTLNRAGLDFVELGYFQPGELVGVSGPGVCEEEFLSKAATVLQGPKMAVMVRYRKVELPHLATLAKYGVTLLRFPIHPEQIEEVKQYIEEAHRLGMICSLNVIFLSQRKFEDLEYCVKKATEFGADYFYVADTISGVIPDQVFSIISQLKKVGDIQLGFHAHDGLRCAFANTLAAIRAGVDIVDSSLGGFGNGEGNLVTELICAYWNWTGNAQYPISDLTKSTEDFLSEWLPSGSRARIENALVGMVNLNPMELKKATTLASSLQIEWLDFLETSLREGLDRTRLT